VIGIPGHPFAGCVLALALTLVSQDVATAPQPLRDLPLTEAVPTRPGGDTFALLVSGDGGWARLDKELSAELSRRGIPVVGLDSLRYFWRARTPDGTAEDVDRIIEHYSAQWHRPRVLLIGYSFGADVMPSVFNRLSSASRARVTSLSLLGLAKYSRYEVTAAEWIPALAPKGTPVMPELQQISAVPILCVEGEGERKSICPELRQPGIQVRQIGHKHHFSYRDSDIVDAVLSVGQARPSPG
jgi:type IV secretory pathway VirJ component